MFKLFGTITHNKLRGHLAQRPGIFPLPTKRAALVRVMGPKLVKVTVINIIHKTCEMQAYAGRLRHQGKTIAFVPTMGFLHEGHLSLITAGRQKGDFLVVSIFVNPAQFGPGEDLGAYPRDLDRDLDLCRKEGVDVVFTPNERELYPGEFQTYVTLEKLPNHLCGLSRPLHFRGVATVVTKLFNIVKPNVAVFGQKDFQQLVIIRQMTRDLNFDIEILAGSTVRETDGLAMSSRNSYLTPEQRVIARCLYQALKKAQVILDNGTVNAGQIIQAATQLILSHPQTAIDYITICDPQTLVDVKIVGKPALMALAVKVGETRLIDNTILKPRDFQNKGARL